MSGVPAPPANLLTISSDRINELPLRRYEGPISIVADARDVVAASLYLRDEQVIGFDTETRPSFRAGEQHPASLLQLAGEEHVFLFQLGRISDLTPLFVILEDPRIRKVGVAIQHDVTGLRRTHPFTPRGFAEIGDLARGLGVHNTGLRTLCGMFLGFRVAKGAKTSNWANKALTDSQIVYAATDAWASRKLYVEMARGARPLHSEPLYRDDDEEDEDEDEDDEEGEDEDDEQ